MSEDALRREIAELRSALDGLAQRIARLEQAGSRGPAPAPKQAAAAPVDPSPDQISLVATRSAVVCFALVGALALRVVAQNGGLAPLVGTSMGLGYCALLIVAPALLGRYRLVSVHGVVLQDCGVLLAPLIVLETFHTYQAMSLTAAVVILSCLGIGASLLGALAGRKGMTGLSLLVQVVAIPALGSPDLDPSLRVASLLGAATMAVVLAHRRQWPFLRALVALPAGVLFSVLVGGSVLQPEVGARSLAPALAGVLGLWVLAAVNHGARGRVMSLGEAAWLPLGSTWAYCALLFALGPAAAPVGAVVAALLAALGLAAAWRLEAAAPVWGLAMAGGALGMLSLPSLDPTGVALALLSLVVLVAARSLESATAAALSAAAVGVATGTALGPGQLAFVLVANRAPVAIAGAILAALQAAYACIVGGTRLEGRGTRSGRWLVPVPLACAFVTVFFTLRGVVWTLTGADDLFHLPETLLLSALCVLGLVLGRRLDTRPLPYAGAAGLVVLLLRVVIQDLWELQGFQLLASVIALGSTFVVASFVLRPRNASSGG